MNENGKVTDKYTYDAFGNLISSTGRTENDFLFAGEQFDAVTGLYYLRARYMNPSIGSFISMDSYSGSIDDPVSLHKYLYANANPVSNSDPSGYSSLADLNASMGMKSAISNINTINAKGILDMVKGMFGFANDIISTIKDGKEQGLSKEDIIANVAAGLVTSLVTNFSCMLTGLGPIGYVIMGVAALVV
ncbi:MAG: RHS repeat-associated core domain-containing protein, partial [Oscillospiraceae bacterium]|nr:RHS repeat-associated core domain-containing protein [Oscillospiraceae bacterium]